MSQMSLLEGLLLNLRGHIQYGRREHLTNDQAYEQLKLHTGQDFGFDFEQWESWITHHPDSVHRSPRRTDA